MSSDPIWHRFLRTNPVYARELRQSVRTGRTIVLLLILAVLVGMFMLAMAGAFGMGRAPLHLGPVLFQVFFSLCFFIVAVVAPTLAAVAVASEKDARTWDALILTGMTRGAIARGKFLTAITGISAFLVMIAPASLLCLLLGGVTVGELVSAFVLLLVIAVIAVAFGVALGAWSNGTAAATLISLATTLVAAPALYFALGFLVSFLAHATWPGVPGGMPVWLPLAYTRAPFDGLYVLLLILLPLAAIALLLWLFYEATLVNMASDSDDRATGLKRWYLVALPFVTALSIIPGAMTRGGARATAWMAGLGGVFVFVFLSSFVLAGDVLAASRRIEFQWHKRNAGWLTRLLGPGLVQTCTLHLVTSLVALASFTLIGAAMLSRGAFPGLPPPAAVGLLLGGEYWSAFLVFAVGFLLWSRVRADSVGGARLLAGMITMVAFAAPWMLFLFFGSAAGQRLYDAMVLASPSPLYVFAVTRAIEAGEPHLALTSALVCSLGWIVMGLTLFAFGARRAARLVAERYAFSQGLEARIAHETTRATHPQTGRDMASMES